MITKFRASLHRQITLADKAALLMHSSPHFIHLYYILKC